MFRNSRNDSYDHYEYQGAFHRGGFQNRNSGISNHGYHHYNNNFSNFENRHPETNQNYRPQSIPQPANEEQSLMDLMKSFIQTQSAVDDARAEQLKIMDENFDQELRSQQATLDKLEEQINIFEDQNGNSSWYDEGYSKSEWANGDYEDEDVENREFESEYEDDEEETVVEFKSMVKDYDLEEEVCDEDQFNITENLEIVTPVVEEFGSEQEKEVSRHLDQEMKGLEYLIMHDSYEHGSPIKEQEDQLNVDGSGNPFEKVDILQTGEPRVSETEVDGNIPLKEEKLEEIHENQFEEVLSEEVSGFDLHEFLRKEVENVEEIACDEHQDTLSKHLEELWDMSDTLIPNEDKELQQFLEEDGEVLDEVATSEHGDITFEELERLLLSEVNDLKEILPHGLDEEFDPDRDLIEIEYLLANPCVTIEDQVAENSEKEKPEDDVFNSQLHYPQPTFEVPNRRFTETHLVVGCPDQKHSFPYCKSKFLQVDTPFVKPFKIELKELHVQGMYQNPINLFILTSLEIDKFLQDTSDKTHELTWDKYFEKDAHDSRFTFTSNMNELMLIRETREWHDEWVKLNRALNVGKTICSFETCLSNA